MVKKIGIVTGTRAEYGLLSRTISLLQNDTRFEVTVFACGAHLSQDHGYTISELQENGVKNIVEVEMLLSSSSRVGVAKSVGLAVLGFADAFSNSSVDAIVVLGDRYEVLAAAQTALFLNIPLIHIHGGEITEGAFDDAIRHSITKMASTHFVATQEFKNRVLQLGEEPNRIFVTGSPGVDNIVNTPRMEKNELEKSLGFKLKNNLALVTYHPVTNANDENENDISQLVNAIKNNPQFNYLITFPNADGGGASIIEKWKSIENLENVNLVPSLGFRRYLSVMEYVSCVIGNSSSGIIEAPVFNVCTINIGTRQKGRPLARSIINVSMRESEISNAISKCTDTDFIKELESVESLYGKGGAAETIVEKLYNIDFNNDKAKAFVDYELNEK